MSNDKTIDVNSGCEDGLRTFERNRYFYGKLLTVRDFETEQSYSSGKRQLLNRIVHGAGIACGLQVTDQKLENSVLKITLTPGVALDCCGREIVVGGNPAAKELEIHGSPKEGLNYIYLKYSECETEPVPVLSNASTCEEKCCNSRIRESFSLEIGDAPDKERFPLSGRITGKTDSEPVEGALIEDLAAGTVRFMTLSDKNGNYTLPLKSGPHTIRASAGGYVSSEKEISVSGAEPGTNLALEDEVSPEGPDQLLKKLRLKIFEEHLAACPDCDDPGVLVAVLRKSGNTIAYDRDETAKYREIIFDNPLLHLLIRNHIADFHNPHRTKHADLPDVLDNEPANTDAVGNKHVSNADANKWNSAIYKINDIGPNGSGSFAVEAGSNISITPGPGKVTIASSGASTGSECFTGRVVFKDVAAGTTKNSSPIDMPDKILGVIMGIEIQKESEILHNLNRKIRLIVTGDEIWNAGMELTSKLDLAANTLTIAITNRTKEVKDQVTVRWWAVTPTKDMGTVEAPSEGKIREDDIIREIAINPNVSMKEMATKYNVDASSLDEIIKPLVDNGMIRTAGSGVNRRFVVNA